MRSTFLVLSLAASGALAAHVSLLTFPHDLSIRGVDKSLLLFGRQLNERQSCDIGDKECGGGCIPVTDSCCPDGSGGCPLAKYCVLGDNNQYGCCPIGETCTGDGGTASCASEGKKDCGTGCIDATDTCCPDGTGGCPLGKYCALGDDNQYGCCPTGQTCTGSGGTASCASAGQKDCGTGCIDITDTCCPDGSGGCPSTKYCVLGSNNEYGCCLNGQTCTGSGGGGGGGGNSTASCASQGKVECGTGCVPAGDTCCPDGSGGCPATKYCVLGSNNEYGCCPIGQTCSGTGGGGGGAASSSVTTPPAEPSTSSSADEETSSSSSSSSSRAGIGGGAITPTTTPLVASPTSTSSTSTTSSRASSTTAAAASSSSVVAAPNVGSKLGASAVHGLAGAIVALVFFF